MYDPIVDVKQFHQFIAQQLTSGDAELSPEGLLDEYRMIHPIDDDEFDDDGLTDLEAVQEALDDIAAGDKGISLEEFDRKFREEHGLPPRK